MAERRLQLHHRLGGDPRDEDLAQPLKRVVIAFEPADAFFNREARLRRPLDGAQAGQGRKVFVRAVILERHALTLPWRGRLARALYKKRRGLWRPRHVNVKLK